MTLATASCLQFGCANDRSPSGAAAGDQNNDDPKPASDGSPVETPGGDPRAIDGFRYGPTLAKAIDDRPAVEVLEAERRSNADLWVLAAEVRGEAGGLGLDAYHFEPNPETAILEPEGEPRRLFSYDGEVHDDALRAELRRATAVPHTRVVTPAKGHEDALASATDPARAVELLGSRAKVVVDTEASPEARAVALAELLGLIKDGAFRRPTTVRDVATFFADGPKMAGVVEGSESRLGLSVELEGGGVVEFERLPGKPPTGLVVVKVTPK